MTGWLASTAAKVVLGLGVVLLLVGLFAVHSCGEARVAKTQAAVSEGQAGAATASGVDAVSVVGNQAAADAATDETTRTNDVEIRKAEGADTVVAAPVRNAGFDALCRRAAYRSDPKCLRR